MSKAVALLQVFQDYYSGNLAFNQFYHKAVKMLESPLVKNKDYKLIYSLSQLPSKSGSIWLTLRGMFTIDLFV